MRVTRSSVPQSRKKSDTVATAGLKSSSAEEIRAVDRVSEVLQDALRVLESSTPPTESAVKDSLTICEDLAKYFSRTAEPTKGATKTLHTPAMNLLFLDETAVPSTAKSATAAALAAKIKGDAVDKVSSTAYELLAHPNVFVTPKLLAQFVNVQLLLERPESLSQMFSLYAQKPIPIAGTNPVTFKAAQPNRASSAVPLGLASIALDAAIDARNLPLCLDMINCTVGAPAFRQHKFVQKALLPLTAAGVAPLAAYTLASQLSVFQDSMSPEMATNIAFAGIIAYIGFTATIGVVAVTTANDQMDRITWVTGTPLRERWLREEERSFIDRVAVAWGFRQVLKRGEEVGEDWATLREHAGMKGMILDRTSLMPGME
jgi:hypothetical protein